MLSQSLSLFFLLKLIHQQFGNLWVFCHYASGPRISLDVMLKMTGAKLDLVSEFHIDKFIGTGR